MIHLITAAAAKAALALTATTAVLAGPVPVATPQPATAESPSITSIAGPSGQANPLTAPLDETTAPAWMQRRCWRVWHPGWHHHGWWNWRCR